MLTVKFIRHVKTDGSAPDCTDRICVRMADAVHVRYESGLRAVVQCGDAPGETTEVTVGPGDECAYSVAYVMNESGRTVETIR